MLCVCVCTCVPQVLPDFRAKGRSAVVHGKALVKAGTEWAARLAKLLHEHGTKEAVKKLSKEMKSDKGIRQGAQDYVKALDHSLQLIGLGLHTFWHDDQAKWLGRSEFRYQAPSKHPAHYGVPDDIVQTRFCVQDKETKAKRFELAKQSGSSSRPVLTLHMDEGPRDFPALWWMASTGARVLFFRDPFHRVARDVVDAVSAAGLTAMVLDTTLCLNFAHAPWKSAAFFGQMQEAMED